MFLSWGLGVGLIHKISRSLANGITYLFQKLFTDLTIEDNTSGITTTFTRASTAYHLQPDGTYVECAANEVRFAGARRVSEGVWSALDTEGDPLPGPFGVLIEPAATNYIKQSMSLNVVPWTVFGDAIVSAAANLLGLPAWSIGRSAGFIGTTGIYTLDNSFGETGNTITTWALAKANGYGGIQLTGAGSDANNYQAGFDLTTGTLVGRGVNTTAASITAMGGGVYLLAVSALAADTTQDIRIWVGPASSVGADGKLAPYTHDGTSKVDITSVHQIIGEIADISSPILSTSAAVTRGADALSYTAPVTPNLTTLTDIDDNEYVYPDWDGVVPYGTWKQIESLRDTSGDFGFDVINTQTIAGQLSTLLGESVTVYWGDGTSNTYSGTDQSYSKNYGSVGSRKVRIVGSAAKLTKFTMTQSGANIAFALSALPRSLTHFYCEGSNTVSGSLGDLPSGLTYFYCTGSNTVSGSLGDLPPVLTTFRCAGSNTVSGSLSDLPTGMTYFFCTGSNTISDYTTRTWANNQNDIYHTPVSPGGLSTAEVDAMLIDLALVASWVGTKRVYLKGTNAARSSASDAAVATLQGKGVTVTTN